MTLVTMAWSCYISWWSCYDLAIIIPWRLWITMIIPFHSMIVMFDWSCQPGQQKKQKSYESSLIGNESFTEDDCLWKFVIKLSSKFKLEWLLGSKHKYLAGYKKQHVILWKAAILWIKWSFWFLVVIQKGFFSVFFSSSKWSFCWRVSNETNRWRCLLSLSIGEW